METNTVNKISFGEIRDSRYLTKTPNQQKTVEKITEELRKPYPFSRKGRSYLNVYENNGYYVYLHQGKANDQVIVAVKRDEKFDETLNEPKETYVGTYDSPKDFNIKDIQKVYIKQREKDVLNYVRNNVAAIIMGIVTLVLGYNIYSDVKKVLPPQKSNPALFIKDLFKRNNVNFVNNGLKIIK